ncbi:hypothetical protein [Streptomyces brasiliensis]|uniref:F5/8 type C domain-containing protein n=1 Tax=Streptomyces brasiliensis TaxID=1954 RepID=A0A917UL61_9ACTN|nr:hypothetical protein [Streptomyces brasiliensis]GGJ65764.1 hypothetical protein GCM10010121_090600 [Streptomyces brasiliensis]
MTAHGSRLIHLTLAAMLLFLTTQLLGAPRAHATTVTGGQYIASTTATDGTPDTSGGVVAFQDSKLFDGDTSDYVGWRGSASAPKKVTLVFDLSRDYPLDSLTFTSNAVNQYWGFDEIEVDYRAEADTRYTIASSATRDRSVLGFSLPVQMDDREARFVRISMTRNNQYLHIPVSEVAFTVGTGTIGQNPVPYDEAALRAELSVPTMLADTYGQSLYGSWPGKVTSDAQLQQDAADEAAARAGSTLDLNTYDQYGGLKGLGTYQATGYFRLGKVDGTAWWFITPEGHKFILKGVDATSVDDWGYATLYQNADGSPRDVFSGLPDKTTYGPAYNGDMVSFVRANLMRKYGAADWKTSYTDMTRKRLVDWGFNTKSKWSSDGITMPWIGHITAPDSLMRIDYGVDPFDPDFASKLDAGMDLSANADSPWLIGYYFDNERGWDDTVMTDMLKRDHTQPAKAAFVAYLEQTYGEANLAQVNSLLGTTAASWTALQDTAITFANVPADDRTAFVTEASKQYYSGIRDAIRRQDTHHLFLGSALVPNWRSSLAWNVGGRDYLDAISLDVYSDSASYLADYEPYDKPVLNLEFSFSTHDRGLRSVNGSVLATSVADRGSLYQAFVEDEAQYRVFVGSGWFAYYDQAVTGRASDGEDFNIGLVNQQDQPYTDMTDVMATTNRQLERIHLNAATAQSTARAKELAR